MSIDRHEPESVPCEEYGLAIDRESEQPTENLEIARRPTSRMQELAATIESAVIPRLLLAHGVKDSVRPGPSRPDGAVANASIEAFVKLLMSHDSGEASEFIDGLLAQRVPIEVILLDIMAPSARLLGEMWTADTCDFVDVTLGLSRMQQMLRKFGGSLDSERRANGNGQSVLLVPAPGEQHTFGLRIIEEFLLRDGWDVRCNLKSTQAETVYTVSTAHFNFVGFTLSGEALIPNLTTTIHEIRRASQNPAIRVLVGGVIFSEQPELLRQVGADALARDARDAVRLAKMWSRLAYLN